MTRSVAAATRTRSGWSSRSESKGTGRGWHRRSRGIGNDKKGVKSMTASGMAEEHGERRGRGMTYGEELSGQLVRQAQEGAPLGGV